MPVGQLEQRVNRQPVVFQRCAIQRNRFPNGGSGGGGGGSGGVGSGGVGGGGGTASEGACEGATEDAVPRNMGRTKAMRGDSKSDSKICCNNGETRRAARAAIATHTSRGLSLSHAFRDSSSVMSTICTHPSQRHRLPLTTFWQVKQNEASCREHHYKGLLARALFYWDRHGGKAP